MLLIRVSNHHSCSTKSNKNYFNARDSDTDCQDQRKTKPSQNDDHREMYKKENVYTSCVIVDSVRVDSVRVDSVRVDSVRVDSVRVDSVRVDSVRVDSVRVDSVIVSL